MRQIEFRPIERTTSRIGLGCGRLVGRGSMRHSARIVETALELGIRYFDVAPSYGLGTAEEVLGEVIGDSKEVVIATKVGVPRPEYSAKADRIRRLAKTALDRLPAFKNVILRAARSSSAERPRYDFTPRAIRQSLETSLRWLRRSSVDVFLAHEPHPEDLSQDLAAGFRCLQNEGLVRAFGVGVGAVTDRWAPFGSIWQSCWPGEAARSYSDQVAHVWHGAVRTASWGGDRKSRPTMGAIVRRVLDESLDSILLVSASTPRRLKDLLSEIDP